MVSDDVAAQIVRQIVAKFMRMTWARVYVGRDEIESAAALGVATAIRYRPAKVDDPPAWLNWAGYRNALRPVWAERRRRDGRRPRTTLNTDLGGQDTPWRVIENVPSPVERPTLDADTLQGLFRDHPRQARLVNLFHMLYSDGMSMAEAATALKVSRQAICQWHQEALSFLRKHPERIDSLCGYETAGKDSPHDEAAD